MLVQMVKACSRNLLPGGKNFRKLRFGPAAGCTMKIDFHRDLRLYLGLYESETRAWFDRLVKKGDKAFDVGGAGGYDALLISKLAGGAAVVSFECDHQAAEDMRETFRRNPYPIETVEGFVGDGDGHISLDEAATRFFTPDFLKIDIEGAEDQALIGATRIITTRKPSMIVEVHAEDKEARCLEILKGHGYDPIIVDRRTLFAETRPLAHNRWLICPGRDAA